MTSAFPDDDDGRVLAEMAAVGVDLSKPLEIEFMVAAADEASAVAIAEALEQTGYAAEVVFDEGELDATEEVELDDQDFGPAWTVYMRVKMVPTHQALVMMQRELDRQARPLGGFADGWEVELG